MSLFADNRYQWRETYFVMFEEKHRPKASDVKKALAELGPKIELQEPIADDSGRLESLTVLAHADSAGMDMIFVGGEEVQEQVGELRKEWKSVYPTGPERIALDRLQVCDARFDVFHFEELGDAAYMDLGDDPDEGVLDPATLLLVLTRLAKLCHGVAIDPAAGPLC